MAIAAAGRPSGHRDRMRSLFGRDPIGYAFIAPYFVFVIGDLRLPARRSRSTSSFHDYFFTAPGVEVDRPFVGFEQLRRRCSPTRVVLRSFRNTLVFLVINVPLTVVLSLVLAAALERRHPFRSFYRVAYYVPYVTASVARRRCVDVALLGQRARSTPSSARSPPTPRGS